MTFDIILAVFVLSHAIGLSLLQNFVVSDSEVCAPGMNDAPKTYRMIVNAIGMGLCCVSPAPFKAIEHTQHQGECLVLCAEYPGCQSYNFHPDSTKCELLPIPEKTAIIQNCFNYIVSTRISHWLDETMVMVRERLIMSELKHYSESCYSHYGAYRHSVWTLKIPHRNLLCRRKRI